MPEEPPKGKQGGLDRRKPGPRPLAASLGELSRRALGRRGFAEAGLITDWEAVVGPELAAACHPERLSFPPGRREGGTLKIRVAGGAATELQHMEPLVLERINGYFGFRAVTRLTLVHAPRHAEPGEPAAARARRTPSSADPVAQGRVETALADVDDAEIRTALARLGQAIIEDRERGGGS